MGPEIPFEPPGVSIPGLAQHPPDGLLYQVCRVAVEPARDAVRLGHSTAQSDGRNQRDG
jgi:hypothetical protein